MNKIAAITSPLMMPLSVTTNGMSAATTTANAASGQPRWSGNLAAWPAAFTSSRVSCRRATPPWIRPCGRQISTTKRMSSEIALENSEEM